MTLSKTLLTGAAALALAASAHAQTVIKITGSSAYRGPTHAAIKNILAAGYTYAYQGTDITKAGAAIFTGSVGGNPVVIKTVWTGSVAGVQTVSKGVSINFLPTATTQSTGGTQNAPAVSEAGIPDIAMSDTYQSSTPFKTPLLTDKVVGVVPFKWVANNGAPSGLNMTPQLAQLLWGNGSAPMSLWTGTNADVNTGIFAIGRDPDSGTRLTAFAESGVGVNSVVTQYQPTIVGGVVTGQDYVAQQIVNGITFPTGQGGYSSGGTLATAMSATGSLAAIGGYYMTYLSTGDAATAITGGAQEMTYNGVAYSTTAVAEGKYTFWGYEHLMYKSTLTGVPKTVATTLANQILNTDATIKISSMNVVRTTDGGLVTP